MQIIVFGGTIIGILAGIVTILQFINTDEDKNIVQLLIGVTLVILISGYALYFFFLGPKSTVETFVDGYRYGNAAYWQESVCKDTQLYSDLALAGTFAGFNSLFGATITNSEISYIPFIGGGIEFDYGTLGMIEHINMKVQVRPEGVTSFCIYEAEER